jgi:hypothetical protein
MTSGSARGRSYATPGALRAGLEAHLAAEATIRGVDPNRLRRQIAFERLLVRLNGAPADPRWVLKGGFALELRLRNRFRATRDLDLASLGDSDDRIDLDLEARTVGAALSLIQPIWEAAAADAEPG